MVCNLNFSESIYNFSAVYDRITDSDDNVRHLSLPGQVFITCFYIFGISVNICALGLLYRTGTSRNRKHTLMLTCLTCNDLLALVGSFLLMYLQLYVSSAIVVTQWFCALRVLLRTFGLSSGCVAIVMAVERFLALTCPFIYQKHVTYKLIKRAIFSLWLIVLFIVCLPFIGFGLYYDSEADDKKYVCVRYRFAKTAKDIAYAYLVFAFGMLLCTVIVCCNLAVVRVLCRIGGKKYVGRMGRTTIHKKSNELAFNHATAEEISFAKLMVVLCIFFVICWVPQMVTILLAQANPDTKEHPFYRIADICIATNFTLDPVFYVLSRRPHRKGLRRLLKPMCQFCYPRPDRIPSVRTSSQDATKITGENITNGETSDSKHRSSSGHEKENPGEDVEMKVLTIQGKYCSLNID